MNMPQVFESHDQLPSRRAGFVLPALIMLSLVLMSAGLVTLQYVSSTTSSIQSNHYIAVAKSAANAGANLAISCIRSGDTSWTQNSVPLTPKTGCNGVDVAARSSTVSTSADGSAVQTTFSVAPLSETPQGTVVTATGTVEFRYAGSSTASKSYSATSKVVIPTTSTNDVRPIAQGVAVTKVKAGGNFSCAIANQQLYCWGINDQGQNGTAVSSNVTTPTLSNAGAITGKRIQDLDLGFYNGCAIADGRAYCWGRNAIGQLGTGGTGGVSLPVAVGGSLASQNVQKITVGTSADASNPSQYACAIAQTKAYCWGANNYAQLGQASYDCIPIIGCFQLSTKPLFTSGVYDATKVSPTEVFGYSNRQFESQSQIYNRNPSDLEAGAYGVCGVFNGRGFCWGNRFVSLPLNDAGGTNDSSGWKNGSLSGKFASSPITGESTACMVAEGRAHCWGARPGDGTNPLLPDGTPQLVPNTAGNPLYGVSVLGGDTTDDQGPICLVGAGNSYCWGAPTDTGLSVGLDSDASAQGAVTSTAGGRDYGCFVANGSAYCIGDNSSYALGDGTTTTRTSPVKTLNIGLTSGEAATDISTGDNHSCAVINGYIYCWGRNSSGQVGDSTNVNRSQPYGVQGITEPTRATAVAAGGSHSCGVINGSAYCWGSNSAGQLGNGSNLDTNSAVLVGGGTMAGKDVTAISAGSSHTCAIANGEAYCWGDNSAGQLGNNTTTQSNVPVKVQGMSGLAVTSITAGGNFSCAIADQRAYCWGSNTYGQIGRAASPQVGGQQLTATAVDALSTSAFTEISAGKDFTCAIVNGYAHCWGNNSEGQLGRSSTASNQWQALRVASPVDGKGTAHITTGTAHACSITNGLAYCWGRNTSGQIGDSSTTQRNTAVTVTASASYLGSNYPFKISAGGNSTCSIANGKIICWGAGSEGQLGTGTTPSLSNAPVGWSADYIRSRRVLDLSRMVAY